MVIRPVENAPVLAAVIVTIGLLLIFNSLAGWIYSYTVQDFPSPFPDRPLFRALITTQRTGRGRGDAGDAGAAVPVLPLHHDRTGDACRRAKSGVGAGCAASVSDACWRSAGASRPRSAPRPASWWRRCLFLDPNMMGGVLLYAFAGALLGGITSPVGAVVGGVIVGVTENLVGTYLIADAAQADRGAGVDHPRCSCSGRTVCSARPSCGGCDDEKGFSIVAPHSSRPTATPWHDGSRTWRWRWLGTRDR